MPGGGVPVFPSRPYRFDEAHYAPFSAAHFLLGVPAMFSTSRFVNPVGSGVVAVLQGVRMGGTGLAVTMAINANGPVTGTLLTPVPRDLITAGVSGCEIRGENVPVSIGTFLYGAPRVGGPALDDVTFPMGIFVGPGTNMFIQSLTAAGAYVFNWYWLEIPQAEFTEFQP